ncbi:PREDICTED: protein WVD2-like 7 isoform X2 [Camelina sativa]|uniref:Protein WVD2-like 7 isoform X2 n=1 Tax=Camelina sativa TaxID=90675 RepID=A0ABM0U4F5_CAMSA|nr:PREDICTED: protein WVD2-like 7 isoform X2 [Camelina sativa]
MGETACLMQPFSYAAPEGGGDSLVSSLGQSVSFGRFMSDKLDWEKWSAFSTSQNPYVAEAERYSKPGSVAQKKAFFEAHYKKLAAARKAAAEEALLLQQQSQPDKLPVPAVQQSDINCVVGKKDRLLSKLDLELPRGSLDAAAAQLNSLTEKQGGCGFGIRQSSDEKENCGMPESQINGGGKVSTQAEEEKKPILLKSLQKKSKDSQPKSSSKPRVSKYNSSSERTPSQKTSNKSSSSSYTFTPAKEFNRLVSIIRKIDGSRASSKPTKDCKTPLRTPSDKASAKGIVEDSLCTPLASHTSSKCRGKIAPESSAKTGRGRWNFLPAETPSCFTPFGLRTEERAERRKKKLEEKFKAMDDEPQNDKKSEKERSVEKEGSKLRQKLCFKAKPLPNFYKQRPKCTDDQTKKALLQ